MTLSTTLENRNHHQNCVQYDLLPDDVTRHEHTGPLKSVFNMRQITAKKEDLFCLEKQRLYDLRMCTPCPVYLRHCELCGFNFCDWQMQKQIEATNVPRYQSLRHGIGDTVQQRRNMGNWSVVQGDQWSRLGTLKGLWSLSDPKQSYPRERNRQKTIYRTSKRK